MRAAIVDNVLEAYRVMPAVGLRCLLGAALGGAQVALCLHRVRMVPAPRGANASGLVIDAGNLDALLDLLVRSGPSDGRRRLTVSFDDGYADAAEYVASRHARYPDVSWLFFVCPQKIEKRAGFRWDAAASGNPAILDAPLDVRAENDRPELRGLGDVEATRLMTVEQCLRIRELPNVALGNHTNTHFKHAALRLEDSRHDIASSKSDFEKLFGPTPHFAFPFGTPATEVGPENAALARELGYTRVWSTEPRPYHEEEMGRASLLPRFPVVGTWPARKIALYMTIRAVRWRLAAARSKSVS
jgi:peptidoglycan/xylan/chitin deacetylase (PgdA/CDA1 family)